MNKNKLTLAVITLTAFSFSSFAPPPKDPPDKIEDYVIVTWNVQGANAGEEGTSATVNKYAEYINQFATGRGVGYNNPRYTGNQFISPHILFLQEAGAPPGSITNVIQLNPLFSSNPIPSPLAAADGAVPALLNPDQLPLNVQEFRWGPRRTGRWVYAVESDSAPDSTAQAQTDQDIGGRVNLTIMTHWRPTSVIILRAPARGAGVRPIFGIQYNNIYFFNIHAPSNGGRNSAAIVARIHDYFAERNDRTSQWAAVGDFNIEPFDLVRNQSTGNLQPSLLNNLYILNDSRLRDRPANDITLINSVRILSQSLITQTRGGVLDYMVIGRAGGDPSWQAQHARPAIPAPSDFTPSRVDHCDLLTLCVSALQTITLWATRAPMQGSDHYPVLFFRKPR